ncbi:MULTISPECIES: alpha/beta hydrolase fold domain-containing protein [unclassified Listeria]|uniref:alpha/beta hydrolase fold domain-containing protein n=1 Tax=unclassified Listeria TaxID=2642072 RepID=UPI000B592733|nr:MULTISPECIES: alpha/beta hydrolase [unclassified Listeria]
MKKSMMLRVIELATKVANVKKIWNLEGEPLKKAIAKKQKQPAVPTKLAKRFNVSKHEIGAHSYFEITPETKTEQTIIYLAGGGFILPITSMHYEFIEQIALETGARLVVPNYPLAPDYHVDDVMRFLKEVYLKYPGDVSLVGDSAGGAIALSFVQFLKLENLALPKKVVGISPFMNFCLDNPAIFEVEQRDNVVGTTALKEIRTWYANGRDYTDSLVSPFFGDFSGIPEILILSSTRDITNPDTHLFYERGLPNVTYYEAGELPHIYPLFEIPESEEARRLIFEMLKMV